MADAETELKNLSLKLKAAIDTVDGEQNEILSRLAELEQKGARRGIANGTGNFAAKGLATRLSRARASRR